MSFLPFLAPLFANATLIGDNVDAVLSNPNGDGGFQINPNFGSGVVGAGVEFNSTASSSFSQIWDFTIDVFGSGFTVGWTEQTRAGDGNISGSSQIIQIALSDLDWVGMAGEIVNVTLGKYSCVSPGFSCSIFGPSNTAIEWGPDSTRVDFSALSHGEQYTFDIEVVHVPEPLSLALVALGLAGMEFSRQRKAH